MSPPLIMIEDVVEDDVEALVELIGIDGASGTPSLVRITW